MINGLVTALSLSPSWNIFRLFKFKLKNALKTFMIYTYFQRIRRRLTMKKIFSKNIRSLFGNKCF